MESINRQKSSIGLSQDRLDLNLGAKPKSLSKSRSVECMASGARMLQERSQTVPSIPDLKKAHLTTKTRDVEPSKVSCAGLSLASKTETLQKLANKFESLFKKMGAALDKLDRTFSTNPALDETTLSELKNVMHQLLLGTSMLEKTELDELLQLEKQLMQQLANSNEMSTLHLPFANNSALHTLTNASWLLGFPVLGFIAFCGSANLFSIGSLQGPEKAISFLAALSTMTLMGDSTVGVISLLKEIFSAGLPISSKMTNGIKLTLSIIIGVFACAADPNSAFRTGLEWQGAPLAWTFWTFCYVATAFLGSAGIYLLSKNTKERFSGNSNDLQLAAIKLINLNNFIISLMYAYMQKHGVQSFALLMQSEDGRESFLKHSYSVAVGRPESMDFFSINETEARELQKLTREATRNHQILTAQLMNRLCDLEPIYQKELTQIKIAKFGMLSIGLVTALIGFGGIFPASYIISVAQAVFGILAFNTHVTFPAPWNATEQLNCTADQTMEALSNMTFPGQVNAAMFQLTTPMQMIVFWVGLYALQAITISGIGVDMQFKLLTIAKEYAAIFSNDEMSWREKLTAFTNFNRPIKTTSALIADCSGLFGGLLFTACYTVNLYKSTPSTALLMNVVTCITMGRINPNSALLSKIVGGCAVFSASFFIGSCIPILMGGAHIAITTLMNQIKPNRDENEPPPIQVLDCASQGEILQDSVPLIEIQRHITTDEFTRTVIALGDALDFDHVASCEQEVQKLSDEEKASIKAEQPHLLQLCEHAFKLKELFSELKQDAISPREFTQRALEIAAQFGQDQQAAATSALSQKSGFVSPTQESVALEEIMTESEESTTLLKHTTSVV